MVSREQKKMQKKKAKEKDNRKKILAEREKRRAVVRAEREDRRRERRIAKLQREMDDFEHLSAEALQDVPDSVLSQLEHNAKILKALESEYTDEMDRKKQLHESLEEDGHFTLEDKMNALNQRTILAQEEIGLGGGADCVVGPLPVRKAIETADVEVVRAVD